MDVPQSHQPVQQCLLGLSAADLPAPLVKACTKACLHGARHKVTGSTWRGDTCKCIVAAAASQAVTVVDRLRLKCRSGPHDGQQCSRWRTWQMRCR